MSSPKRLLSSSSVSTLLRSKSFDQKRMEKTNDDRWSPSPKTNMVDSSDIRPPFCLLHPELESRPGKQYVFLNNVARKCTMSFLLFQSPERIQEDMNGCCMTRVPKTSVERIEVA